MDERRAPTECPKCGGPRVASILYGLPDFEAIEDDLAAGRIVLGGCFICEGDPEWACEDCDHRWGAVEFLEPSAGETAD
jgi:hypothetical protein